MMAKSDKTALGWLVLPDQMFDVAHLPDVPLKHAFCREDMAHLADEAYHLQRTAFYVGAYRAHVDALRGHGLSVTHQPLEPAEISYAEHAVAWAKKHACAAVHTFEIINKQQRRPVIEAFEAAKIPLIVHASPMFLTSTEQFRGYLKGVTRPFMRTFYEGQRKRLNLLVHPDERPIGGKWSFDEDNRKPLPDAVPLPDLPEFKPTKQHKDAWAHCRSLFGQNPGAKAEPWLPITRAGALRWLDVFITQRFVDFGPYEDALSHKNDVLFHSVLTPFLNSGLLTPQEVVERAVRSAKTHNVPINSLEGFIRQIIGWREFIRGIYEAFSERQDKQNFFRHSRNLSPVWYGEGDSGVPPLDDTLNKVSRLGWAHHIERLMVLGNLMLLLEVDPKAAHRWFMEMFVDSHAWVMGPNVYGMALFSDGGIFATKPYICGSNYLRKMGNYKKGPWCDGVDGLYWRFVERHRAFLQKNARMHFAVKTIERMDPVRKAKIYAAADALQARLTQEAKP